MNILLDDVVSMYYDEGKSLREIATVYNTYPNKIRKLLISNGYDTRNKSEAQKNALQSGKVEHPTAGKERTEEEKEKISKSLYDMWENMDDDERDERKEKARENWNLMTQAEKEAFFEASRKAVRQAAQDGSKLEQFLKNYLNNHGYVVTLHEKGIVENTSLEVDIHLPFLRTVIEIDGPSHFFPIWGEDALQKTIKADQEKTGLLLTKGFCVIRVKDIRDHKSNRYFTLISEKVLEVIEKINTKFPPSNKRFIELEI